LDAAKLGNTFSPLTMSLFYATDFADRLENQIIPALEAGFYVLSDRYFYSTIARDVVRGADPDWARKLYNFALKPDIVFLLKSDVQTLVKRVVSGRGFDHWESGMDIRCADNLYDSFCIYQGALIEQFAVMSKEFNFVEVDATRSPLMVHNNLKRKIQSRILKKS
jgi:dTMP kinase